MANITSFSVRRARSIMYQLYTFQLIFNSQKVVIAIMEHRDTSPLAHASVVVQFLIDFTIVIVYINNLLFFYDFLINLCTREADILNP